MLYPLSNETVVSDMIYSFSRCNIF